MMQFKKVLPTSSYLSSWPVKWRLQHATFSDLCVLLEINAFLNALDQRIWADIPRVKYSRYNFVMTKLWRCEVRISCVKRREEKRRGPSKTSRTRRGVRAEKRSSDGQPAWPTKHTETCSFRPKPKPVIAFRPGHPAAHPTIPMFPRYCLIISRGFNERDARNQFSRARASCPLSARLCPNW